MSVNWSAAIGIGIFMVLFGALSIDAATSPDVAPEEQGQSTYPLVIALIIASLFFVARTLVGVSDITLFRREEIRKAEGKLKEEVIGYQEIGKMLKKKKDLSISRLARLEEDRNLNIPPESVALFTNLKGKSFMALQEAYEQVKILQNLNLSIRNRIGVIKTIALDEGNKYVQQILEHIGLEEKSLKSLEEKLEARPEIAQLNNRISSAYEALFNKKLPQERFDAELASASEQKVQKVREYLDEISGEIKGALALDEQLKNTILTLMKDDLKLRSLLDELSIISQQATDVLLQEDNLLLNPLHALQSQNSADIQKELPSILEKSRELARKANELILMEERKYREYSSLLAEHLALMRKIETTELEFKGLEQRHFGERLKFWLMFEKGSKNLTFKKGKQQIMIPNLNRLLIFLKHMPDEEFNRLVEKNELSKWISSINPEFKDLTELAIKVHEELEVKRVLSPRGKELLVEIIQQRFGMDFGKIFRGENIFLGEEKKEEKRGWFGRKKE